MTALQCQTCAKPSPHCQDPQFKHLMAATCWMMQTEMSTDDKEYLEERIRELTHEIIVLSSERILLKKRSIDEHDYETQIIDCENSIMIKNAELRMLRRMR